MYAELTPELISKVADTVGEFTVARRAPDTWSRPHAF
jgi:hypothetical protein